LAQLASSSFHELDAAAPRQHQESYDAREQQREPTAFEQFDRVCREEDAIDDQKKPLTAITMTGG
jgi:hypothetical protein